MYDFEIVYQNGTTPEMDCSNYRTCREKPDRKKIQKCLQYHREIHTPISVIPKPVGTEGGL